MKQTGHTILNLRHGRGKTALAPILDKKGIKEERSLTFLDARNSGGERGRESKGAELEDSK